MEKLEFYWTKREEAGVVYVEHSWGAGEQQ